MSNHSSFIRCLNLKFDNTQEFEQMQQEFHKAFPRYYLLLVFYLGTTKSKFWDLAQKLQQLGAIQKIPTTGYHELASKLNIEVHELLCFGPKIFQDELQTLLKRYNIPNRFKKLASTMQQALIAIRTESEASGAFTSLELQAAIKSVYLPSTTVDAEDLDGISVDTTCVEVDNDRPVLKAHVRMMQITGGCGAKKL